MEFPRHLHKPEGLYVVVQNEEQYDAVKANGWADRPDNHVEKPVEVRLVDAVGAAVPLADAPVDEPKVRGRRKRD